MMAKGGLFIPDFMPTGNYLLRLGQTSFRPWTRGFWSNLVGVKSDDGDDGNDDRMQLTVYLNFHSKYVGWSR